MTSPRLERLARWLAQDPANAGLLAEAVDEATACGALDQSLAWLDAAQARGLAGPEWTWRRARLAIARRELAQAEGLLQALRAELGDAPAVLHDLAYVRLLAGDAAACRELLRSWVQGQDGPPPQQAGEALQLLWLRAVHRAGLTPAEWDWICQADTEGRLPARAQGVASLIALDQGDFERTRRFAQAGLAAEPEQHEALVAAASVALAQGDAAQASLLLQPVVERHPQDGRSWSTLGLASLQQQQLPQAEAQFERAVGSLPDHIGSWHALGWTRLLQGKHAGARAAFERALALDRNFAESHGALGLVLALAGDAAQAAAHLDRADRLDPASVTGRYARALLAGQAGEPAQLAALARRLLDRPGFFGGKLADAGALCSALGGE